VKWCRRHPANASLLAAGLLVLVVSLGGVWHAGRLQVRVQEGRLAAADHLVHLAEKHKPHAGARSRYVEELLADGEKILAELRKSGDESPAVLETTARLQLAYSNIEVRLNNTSGAVGRAQESRALYEKLLEKDPRHVGWRGGLALSYDRLGRAFYLQGRSDDSMTARRTAVALLEETCRDEPEDDEWQSRLAAALYWLGRGVTSDHASGGAERLKALRSALTIRRRLAENNPQHAQWQYDFAESLYTYANNVYYAQIDRSGVESSYREALEILQKLVIREPDHEDWQRGLSEATVSLADLKAAEGRHDEARTHYQTALDLTEERARQYPLDAWWQRQVMTVRYRKAAWRPVRWEMLQEEYRDYLAVNQEQHRLLKQLA
jgi:tetratricopeptide (TPR) repeat protein